MHPCQTALRTCVFGGGDSLAGTVANQNMDWFRSGTAANRLERPSVSNACRTQKIDATMIKCKSAEE
jgi:hypothetical protein